MSTNRDEVWWERLNKVRDKIIRLKPTDIEDPMYRKFALDALKSMRDKVTQIIEGLEKGAVRV